MIRNSSGIWVNSEVFREEARHFQKHGYFCPDPTGSPAWFDYWKEQTRRIKYGYEVGGAKITGDHYFYLNFCPIQKTEDQDAKKSRKVLDFPDFWDGDYNYFWVRDIARDGIIDAYDPLDQISIQEWENILNTQDYTEAYKAMRVLEKLNLDVKIDKDSLNGGYNLIVGKSRRKGYSYKNASIGVKNYITRPNSVTVYGAYEKRFLYPKGILTMAFNYLNFINEHTAWSMPSDYINRTEHKKASYKEYKNGIEIEKGFKSEILGITFKDNMDAARGKDIFDLVFEESGAFGTPGLLKGAYAASEDCVKDGEIKTGLITIFGTSGDMEGGTADYAEMFYNPKRFSLLPLENILEDDESLRSNLVGFFHPVDWNFPGYYDSQGNSLKKEAKEVMMNERQRLIDNGATSTDLQQKLQEKPFNPSEAFAYTSTNIFPAQELKKRLEYLRNTKQHLIKGQAVTMYRDSTTREVRVEPDLHNKLQPIHSYDVKESKSGCPVIYEYPIPGAPRGLYKIGYDPVRQDEGSSLASIIVYKGVLKGSHTKNCIVAEYIGRKEQTEDIHYIAELFAELYNTQIMYENEVPDVKSYFQRRRLLHLLALQPDRVIGKNVKSSKVNRVFGCHMNMQLKDAGERYIKQWLLEVQDFDEDSKVVTAIDHLYSIRLIEELLNYNKKGNFDHVSSLIMCMFQVQEEEIGKEYSEKKENKSAKKLLEMRRNMFKNNSNFV